MERRLFYPPQYYDRSTMQRVWTSLILQTMWFVPLPIDNLEPFIVHVFQVFYSKPRCQYQGSLSKFWKNFHGDIDQRQLWSKPLKDFDGIEWLRYQRVISLKIQVGNTNQRNKWANTDPRTYRRRSGQYERERMLPR
jgi:hypothetical protein